MKDLELKIEKAQSLKDSLKDQHQALDDEIKAKSVLITEKTMRGEFDNVLMSEVKELSTKIKDITNKDINYQKEIDSYNAKLENNKKLLLKTDEEERRINANLKKLSVFNDDSEQQEDQTMTEEQTKPEQIEDAKDTSDKLQKQDDKEVAEGQNQEEAVKDHADNPKEGENQMTDALEKDKTAEKDNVGEVNDVTETKEKHEEKPIVDMTR